MVQLIIREQKEKRERIKAMLKEKKIEEVIKLQKVSSAQSTSELVKESPHHDQTTENQIIKGNLKVPRDVEGFGAWGWHIKPEIQ